MYVAVKGGEAAIANAHRLLAETRRGDTSVPELSVAQIREQMALLVDRVMTEGSPRRAWSMTADKVALASRSWISRIASPVTIVVTMRAPHPSDKMCDLARCLVGRGRDGCGAVACFGGPPFHARPDRDQEHGRCRGWATPVVRPRRGRVTSPEPRHEPASARAPRRAAPRPAATAARSPSPRRD